MYHCINVCIAECVYHGNLITIKLGTNQMLEMGIMMGFPVNGK